MNVHFPCSLKLHYFQTNQKLPYYGTLSLSAIVEFKISKRLGLPPLKTYIIHIHKKQNDFKFKNSTDGKLEWKEFT